MKTNAQVDTVLQAVKTVSSKLYEDNVVFRKEPHHITKNVVRFTLKTKDAEKPGSIVTKNGQKHPKANWQVHTDVIKEIFKLEPKSNIYVDTIAGRLYNDNIPKEQPLESELKEKLKDAINFIFDHRDLLQKAL